MFTQNPSLKGILPALVLGGGNVALAAAVNGACPPLGPVLPAPTNLAQDSDIQCAVKSMKSQFEKLTASLNTTGVSIAVQSIHDETPFLELHHTPAARNATGTNKIDSDTVYRLGSLSKIFAMYAALQLGVKYEDPVTKYVPELLEMKTADGEEQNNINTVAWDQVTIGALASHMSGIGVDLVQDMASYSFVPWTKLGLPEADPSELTMCAGLFGLPSCPKSEFFRDFGKRYPIFGTQASPAYSNVGYAILGFVVEAASGGMKYDDYIQKNIFDPLGMDRSSIYEAPQESELGFIPAGTDGSLWWGTSLGYEDISGGFYGSTRDVLSLGISILSHTLLDRPTTARWMKPQTSTSAAGVALGGVWEIMRTTSVTADNRLIELYCKNGNLGSYNNYLCTVPDYDLVISILSAGGGSNIDWLDGQVFSPLVKTILPAVEKAGKTQAAARKFVGTFFFSSQDGPSQGNNGNGNSTTITLSQDDGPGLVVSDWVSRDVDVLDAWAAYSAKSELAVGMMPNVTARLYPTDLKKEGNNKDNKNKNNNNKKMAWRAVVDTQTPEEKEALDEKMFWADRSCSTWAGVDRQVYQFRSLDEFVFEMDEGGTVVGLSNVGFQVDMKRQ